MIRCDRHGHEGLSSDHDPLYRFHQWRANLRILGVTEIKPSPIFPGLILSSSDYLEPSDESVWTRWCFGRQPTWKQKLIAFRTITIGIEFTLVSREKLTIETMESKGANLKSYRWQPHCRGLYQTPIAARALIRHGQESLLVAAKYAP